MYLVILSLRCHQIRSNLLRQLVFVDGRAFEGGRQCFPGEGHLRLAAPVAEDLDEAAQLAQASVLLLDGVQEVSANAQAGAHHPPLVGDLLGHFLDEVVKRRLFLLLV